MRFAMAVTLLGASLAYAQPVRDHVERANDKKELRHDRRQLAEDRMDAQRARAMLRDYEVAMSARDLPRLRAIDDAYRRFVAQEIAESRAESHQARQEIREDKAELNGDRREIRRDVEEGRRPAVVADDVRDRNRDRANLADDVRDARAERLSRQRLQAIETELNGLHDRFDPGSVAQKRALYAEVLGQAVEELHRDKQELREDRRELREDRRESHEDRRAPPH